MFCLPRHDVDGDKWEDVVASAERICKGVEDAPTRAVDSDAIIVYTSGSTGQPKGVVHTFESLTGPCKGITNLHGISRADRYLSYLPIAHVMDRVWLAECVSLCSGMHVFFAESLKSFKDDLQRTVVSS